MEATKMSQEEYALANDYNTNSAFLNSVLQKLSRLDIELKGLQDMFKDCKTSAGDTESQRQEVDVNINHELDIIRKELYTKLNSMLDQLKQHQVHQQADALKLQQEISMENLKKYIGKELEIRRLLSTSHLYSSAFVVFRYDSAGNLIKRDEGVECDNNVPARFELVGAGWGHGVGLCQIGAAVMGEKGYLYDQILMHYYPNSELDKRY